MQNKTSRHASPLNRRQLLQRLGLGLAAVPLVHAACSDDSGGVDVDAAGGDASIVDAPPGSAWASGGTAAMTGLASYPDPFTGALTSCALVAATTEGPCTTATDLARVDISESLAGLPVRLALKVVDSSCAPVAGATVKIWHTDKAGVYSGQTPSPGMCSNNNATAIAANWFRGVQTTGADGTAFFNTCFPGWYNGRAIHLHFQVKRGNTSYRISQLFFPEDVTAGIFTSHPEYQQYGQPNTLLATDNVAAGVGAANLPRLMLTVARMNDGAMLASKVVTVM